MNIICRITFIDGEKLYISDEMTISGFVAYQDKKNRYYLKRLFDVSYQFDYWVEVAGMINMVDYFFVGDDIDNGTLYKSTSVKSIDNEDV